MWGFSIREILSSSGPPLAMNALLLLLLLLVPPPDPGVLCRVFAEDES